MTDRATIAAIRFGHGLPLPVGAPTDPQAMIAALQGRDLAAREWPGLGLAALLPAQRAATEARRLARQDAISRRDYRATVKVLVHQQVEVQRIMLARAIGSPDGLRERLVMFWADHFTTIARFQRDRTLPLALIEDAVRPHVAGPFGAMLTAAVLHPAMLVYLDQVLSVGPNSRAGTRKGRGLNENLARELLELHTLGVGAGYAQADVRQMAELLTGLRFDPATGTGFSPGAAEPGAETVLGRTYDGEGTGPIKRMLADLAVNPATAHHICGKLAVHFVGDEPDPDLTSRMAAVWAQTGGDLAAVYAAMLDHPAAWSLPLGKARQPWDFVAAAFRALGIAPGTVQRLGRGLFVRTVKLPLGRMGQTPQEPPGPDGWPEPAAAWITPQGLAARITWAMTVPQQLRADLPDPVALADAALGPLADGTLRRAVSRAENRREGVGLVLASPAFNRR